MKANLSVFVLLISLNKRSERFDLNRVENGPKETRRINVTPKWKLIILIF